MLFVVNKKSTNRKQLQINLRRGFWKIIPERRTEPALQFLLLPAIHEPLRLLPDKPEGKLRARKRNGRKNKIQLVLNSPVARKAAAAHVTKVKAFVQDLVKAGQRGADSSNFALQAPAFPEPGQSETVDRDTIPTYAYNWNVSPLTPKGVAVVIWIPSASNIGENPADYAAELEVYAKSLPLTYSQKEIQFLYAQPTAAVVEGITAPKIPGAQGITFDQWPKSLKEMAAKMANLAQ